MIIKLKNRPKLERDIIMSFGSINKFAYFCGIGSSTAHRVLRGQTKMTIETANKIAKTMDCDFKDIFKIVDEK